MQNKKIRIIRNKKTIEIPVEYGVELNDIVFKGDRLELEDCVLYEWKLCPVMDDDYDMQMLTFKVHKATKKHNMFKNVATYRVDENAEGALIIRRAW